MGKGWLYVITFLTLNRLVMATPPLTARLFGKVTDTQNLPLPGVSVSLAQNDKVLATVWTNENGEFLAENLEPGLYSLHLTMDGFQPLEKEVTLHQGDNGPLQLALQIVGFSEAVTVEASGKEGEVAILEERRQAFVATDNLSRQELSKNPDGNAGAALSRVTGISTFGERYVFVRGLGERYLSVRLNGVDLPSTVTERRYVPLDIFPSQFLSTIRVYKTYTAELPGTFGGGLVDLETLNKPSEVGLHVSWSNGYEPKSTGEDFFRYAGGLSFLGEGGQAIPRSFPATFISRASRFNPDGYTPEQLQVLGRQLLGAWRGESRTAPANRSWNLSFARSFGPFGILLAAGNQHAFSNQEERQRFFGLAGERLDLLNDYHILESRENVRTGVFASLSWEFSPSDAIRWNTLFSRNAEANDRRQEGLNTNSGRIIRDFRPQYFREDMITHQLSGQHFIKRETGGLELIWRLARGRATNRGDIRENIYGQDQDGAFRLMVGYPEAGRIEFYDLQDTSNEENLTTSWYYQAENGIYGAVKGGLSHISRQRDFLVRRFRFVLNSPNQFDLALPPEELLTEANVRPDAFELREVTGVNDAYTGNEVIKSLFVQSEVNKGKFRISGGLRWENAQQEVVTTNPFAVQTPEIARLDNSDLLPAINFIYSPSGKTNFRLAAGRTLNRPEFRELSPFTFVEITGGRSVAGNPRLQRALLDAIDLRWETFPHPRNLFAVSAFFKSIHHPIERIVQPTTELRTSWTNAKSAHLKGVELEGRSSLEPLHPALRFFNVNFNYTFVRSDVTISEEALNVVTSRRRALVGQPDHVMNMALEYQVPGWRTLVRLLVNYTSRYLTDLGSYGLPDIYKDASTRLDMVVRQDLSALLPGVELTLAGKNLTGNGERYLQGGETQRDQKGRRSVVLNLAYKPNF
ncbi:MAG: outer membrane beta-barrel protein [Thermoanaerobaculaceae bacterium]